jgi:ribonuclease J
MLNIVSAAIELGYMKVPAGVIVDMNDIRRFKPSELTLITTGSQGEPMSALYRMTFSDHSQVTLDSNDLVVLSASAIPGNEKLVGRIINELSKKDVEVLHDAVVEVHVSGHACQEELKLMQALTKPRYFMPIHGESRHLLANRDLAKHMGISPDRIFVSEIGKVLEIDASGARFNGTAPAGKVLVDGYGVGDVGTSVLRERRLIGQDGVIVASAAVDMYERRILTEPFIASRGFIFVKEPEDLIAEMEDVTRDALNFALGRKDVGIKAVRDAVSDKLSDFLYKKTKRSPVIVPIITEIE